MEIAQLAGLIQSRPCHLTRVGLLLQTLERRTIRKVSWRLLPLIVIIYFVAYIDRTNVSFAALTMVAWMCLITSEVRAAPAHPITVAAR